MDRARWIHGRSKRGTESVDCRFAVPSSGDTNTDASSAATDRNAIHRAAADRVPDSDSHRDATTDAVPESNTNSNIHSAAEPVINIDSHRDGDSNCASESNSDADCHSYSASEPNSDTTIQSDADGNADTANHTKYDAVAIGDSSATSVDIDHADFIDTGGARTIAGRSILAAASTEGTRRWFTRRNRQGS